jgi:single-stranded-DNA-specific exonuclease
MNLFNKILAARGISDENFFISPDFEKLYDPYLMPDMKKAVARLILALEKKEKITIYGDYDIDGLCATALINDALVKFGFKDIKTFIPNRFTEGYGLSESSIKNFANDGTKLLITVDCGSRSVDEIKLANSLGIDVIVTDHHNALDEQPPAIAVINPKRKDSVYPFADLAGVGVVFKLVQALQSMLNSSPSTSSGSTTHSTGHKTLSLSKGSELAVNPSTSRKKTLSLSKGSGLPYGQEKWLLDLVALGTVCDVVTLTDENRILAYWGLKVLQKTRRQGLMALMTVADIKLEKVNARTLGFGLGPRMNAAGRLETAKMSLDLLLTQDKETAFEIAQNLDKLNTKRRFDQEKILKQATQQADDRLSDSVLVLSGKNWNHGIVGIVASKLMEKYHKPVFVMQELTDKIKGSTRSFGDFDISAAVDLCRDLLLSGGGHKLAAGISLEKDKLENFRTRINDYYRSLKLKNQESFFIPVEDVVADLVEIDQELIDSIDLLEPFGNGNPKPVLKTENLIVENVKIMGNNGQHIKLKLKNKNGVKMDFLAFNAPDYFFVKVGDKISVWYQPEVNEWQNNRTIEGKLVHLELIN